MTTADDTINGPGWDKLTGAGLINAYDAVFGPAGTATFPFGDGLESGVLTQVYETHTTGAGRIEVTSANGPAQGSLHAVLTTAHDGRSGRNEVILHVNAAGLMGAVLSFREREFNDADQPMSASFQGSENTDGVALSVDGVNWYRIASFTGLTSTNSYQLQRYSLAAVAAANGLTLGIDTRIKFQQFGNLKTPRGGIALDDISIVDLPGVSFGNTSYSVSESGVSATITVLRAGNPTLPIQIDFATSNDTATAPDDYLSTSGTLLFQAGETTKTINIPIVSDRLIEGPETVNVSLSNISSGVLLTPSDVKLTILDDQDLVAPGSLTATATGPSSVRLDWVDNSDNETEFQIERKVGVGQFTPLATALPQVTTYSDAGLSTNTLYTYRVRAVAGSAASSYSNQVSVNISPIELEKGTYTVSEDAGFIVVRVTRSGDILSTASVQLATVDGTATAGLDYAAQALTVNFVRGETTKEILIPITADRLLEQNEAFDVVLSNPNGGTATLGDQKKATITITNGGALPAPSNLAVAVAGASQVQLTWKDNCTNETAIDIERRTGQGGFVPLVSLAANSESYSDNTVVAGTVYTYRVRASQGELVSDYSNEVSTAVTSLQFEVAGYSVLEDDLVVNLKVTRSGDPSLPVTVKYATSDGTATAGGDYASSTSTLVFAPAETSKTVTINVKDDDLLEGPETFNVTLSGAIGTGTVIGSPGVAVVTLNDNQGRLTPSNLSAAVLSGSQVGLSWTDHSGNETKFEIERRVLGGTFAKIGETAADETAYTDTGLAANSSYTYRVRALNASGTSGYSNDASVTTLPPAPQAPSNLTAAAQDAGKVHLAWTDNSLDESGFVLERKDGSSGFALVAALAENSRSYTDTGRLPGHTYTYQVRSVNAGGESDNSNSASVTLSSLPGEPTALTASPVSSSAIRLDWTVGSNSTSTRIERRTDGSFVLVGTVAQGVNAFVDQGVQAGVTYTYRVLSASPSGESAPSNMVQVSISTLARIKVNPAKLAFGKAKAGAVRTKTFTIKNTGSGVLGGAISAISQSGPAPGAFQIVSGGEPFSLARGQVRKVTVQFQTDTAGAYQGSLTITSSDPGRGTTTVKLSAASK
jgi:fibronectin type 3 domain-containing protein